MNNDKLKDAAQQIVNHVTPRRLARNYCLDGMEIPGHLLRQLWRALGSPGDGDENAKSQG